jgi:ACR3 family arsenite transporter
MKEKRIRTSVRQPALQASKGKGLNSFERYLTVWVALCIVVGVMIGQFLPSIPDTLGRFTYAEISIPIAILIWLMIYPMMVQIDFSSILGVRRQPKGLTVTLVVNWLIKPFSMFFFAWLFLEGIFAPWIPEALAREYVAGAILLGAAPCTAMVFVWSYLTRGDPAYTLVQVAINDLIMLFAFAPIVALLLGVSQVTVPFATLLLSVILYIVIPLLAGAVTRTILVRRYGLQWFSTVFLPKFGPMTMVALLLTLILIFSFQGQTILSNPLHIILIAVPLIIQTFFIFSIAYGWAKLWNIPHQVAAPAAMIGASNFFELAVAAAIALFGVTSGAALAAVVGVLVEVPVMLVLVRIANVTKGRFATQPAVSSD